MHDWLTRLDHHFPVRYTAWFLAAVLALLFAFTWVAFGMAGGWALFFLFLVGLGFRDTRQSRHSILRNYPVIGHLRFLLEFVRPEIRQYFIESDREAAPFSRQQRSLVYQRSKGAQDKRPFGTQLDVGAPGYEWINHSMAPTAVASHDFRITIGDGGSSCTQPYSASVFNISAMSFGALSSNAILALNAGARRGGFAHDTGEGSISAHHRVHGGDLIWEIGSGYFGCRNDDGSFNAERFAENACDAQVKMIEVKLSQGAKPGHGGVLPGAKVTPEIAAARGVAPGVDCISPARHSAFATPVEMLQFIERLRMLSGGKPVGFKFCVGHPWEWFAIAKAMRDTQLLPDFIVVDGAEGGTGAAPLEFTDHVGAPLQEGLLLVHNTLVGLNLRERIKLGCAGKVISGFDIARMMAIGADWCNAARGFMFALGCLQAQRTLPHRRGDAGPAAPEGAGGARQGRARVALPREHARGPEGTGAGLRADAPGPDQRAPHRASHSRAGGQAAGQPAALHQARRPAGCRARRGRLAAQRLSPLLAAGRQRELRGGDEQADRRLTSGHHRVPRGSGVTRAHGDGSGEGGSHNRPHTQRPLSSRSPHDHHPHRPAPQRQRAAHAGPARGLAQRAHPGPGR
jgi:glutamate synthase domain-containing protein 2